MCRVYLSGLGRFRGVVLQGSYETPQCSWSASALRDQFNQSSTLKTGVPWMLLSPTTVCAATFGPQQGMPSSSVDFCCGRRNAKPQFEHRHELHLARLNDGGHDTQMSRGYPFSLLTLPDHEEDQAPPLSVERNTRAACAEGVISTDGRVYTHSKLASEVPHGSRVTSAPSF